MQLNEKEKESIRLAVLEAEKSTNGEIVPVIVKHSDLYPSSHFRWSFIVSFLALSLCYWYTPLDDIFFLYTFLLGSVLGYFCAYIPFLKKIVLTKDQLEEEFRQRAFESFLLNGVTETKNRNGVQIFVSAFEQKAIIIADIGIQEKLDNEVWQNIINAMIPKLKKKQYQDAIISAIQAIGAILATHFPQDHDDLDELPNKIIIEL
jgi:putative membrane protein